MWFMIIGFYICRLFTLVGIIIRGFLGNGLLSVGLCARPGPYSLDPQKTILYLDHDRIAE